MAQLEMTAWRRKPPASGSEREEDGSNAWRSEEPPLAESQM